jgi:serine/threonine-protein kinase HipA
MVYRPVDVIEVRLWETTVGAIAFDTTSNFYAFEYDPAFIAKGLEISPLHMPTGPQIYTFPTLSESTYLRLPAVFADSLPDDFGNALVNAELAREGVPSTSITPLDRLAYLGSRGTGALEYRPARGPRTRTATAIEIAELVSAARSALSGTVRDDQEAQKALTSLIQVGTSAGGARAKAVIAWNPVTNEVRSGQTEVPPGFEHWLLKLDVGDEMLLGQSLGYGRVEFAYYLMARAAGITMTESRLLEEGGRAHFMTRRFDRTDGERVHTQTLCAMDHLDYRLASAHSYAQYFQVLHQLGLSDDEHTEGFRRMVFNLFAANLDDHTKNLSFMMAKDGRWSLAPAYDVTHSYNAQGRWASQHQMSVNGKYTDITLVDIEAVADRYAIPGWRQVLSQVQDAVSRWPEFAESAGLSQKRAAVVATDMATLRPLTS